VGEKEYNYLSDLHHVVLSLNEVDHPVQTVTEELDTRSLTNRLHFPVFPSTSTLPEFVASSRLSSVLMCRSLHRTLSAHGTRRPGLLRPQNLPCACDGVSPESCVSLGAMPCEASSLGICTSSGVRPNLVSDCLRHVFIHTMLIPALSPRLSSNPFRSPRRAFTATTPFSHNQSSFAHRTAHSSSAGHTPPTLSPLSDSFSAFTPLPYLSTVPTLNTFVQLTQWNTFYSPLFVGKTHRVMSRLVRLATDPVALHHLAYPRGSNIGFGDTQPCSRNQPLDQGSTTGSNLAVERARCALSA